MGIPKEQAETVKTVGRIPKSLANCDANFDTHSFALLDYFVSALRESNPRIPITQTVEAKNKGSSVWSTEKFFLEKAFEKYTASLSVPEREKLLTLDSEALLKQILHNTIREYHLLACIHAGTTNLTNTQMREVYAQAYEAYLTLIVIPQAYIEYLFSLHNSSAIAKTMEDGIYRERIIKSLTGDKDGINASEKDGAVSGSALSNDNETTIWREIKFLTDNISRELKINTSGTTDKAFAEKKQYEKIMSGGAIEASNQDLEGERFSRGDALEYKEETKNALAQRKKAEIGVVERLHSKKYGIGNKFHADGSDHIPLIPLGTKGYGELSCAECLSQRMKEADDYFRSVIIPEYQQTENFIYTQIGLCIIEAAIQSPQKYKQYADAIERSEKSPLQIMSILRSALAETKKDPEASHVLLAELAKHAVFAENGILPLGFEKAVQLIGKQNFAKPSPAELKNAAKIARARYDEKTRFNKHQPIFGIAYWSLHHGLAGQKQANDVIDKANGQNTIDEIMTTLAEHLHHGPGGSREKSFKYNLEAVLEEQLAEKYPEYWSHIKQIFKSSVDCVFIDDDLSSSAAERSADMNRRESTSSSSSSGSSTNSTPGTPEQYIDVVCMHLDNKIAAWGSGNEVYSRTRISS